MDRPDLLRRRLENLRENRTSGATDLTLEMIGLALDWLSAGHSAADLAGQIRTIHPGIATVANIARILEDTATDLPSVLLATKNSLLEGNRKIAAHLEPLIRADSAVITLSNSSTVREALLALAVSRVYVMESRPGGEGAAMAADLRNGLGRKSSTAVELIVDAAMGITVGKVHCALVGIDSYDSRGGILHKLGTLPLALCCRHFGKPIYAAGHSLKFSDHTLEGWPASDSPLRDQFFDYTPAKYITRIITERESS